MQHQERELHRPSLSETGRLVLTLSRPPEGVLEGVASQAALLDGAVMKDRGSLLLLGAWLMGSVVPFVVAPTNFRMVDELLQHASHPSFRATIEQVGTGPSRELLRFLSSELNRDFFLRWNVLQVALGGAVLVLSWRPPAERRVRNLVLAATLIVAVLLLVLTPLIIEVGRSLDFVPREPPPPQLARFQLLHVLYTGLELAKLGCVLLAAFWSLRAGSRRDGAPPAEAAGASGRSRPAPSGR